MSNDLADAIQRARNNPLAFVTGVIDVIDANGSASSTTVVDASNPVVQLIEVSAFTLQTSVDEQRSIVRELYPQLSETREEVYRHLSDRDKVNIHALPSRTTITLAISIEELISRAVYIDGSSVRKLTVPPQTRFRVNGIEFGMYYPIDIRILSHGSIRAVWNNDVTTSPISLSENILETRTLRVNTDKGAVEYLMIDIPVEQFSLETFSSKVQASGFKQLFSYTDSFYFARVYISDGTVWNEVNVTFSNTVYDIGTLTAVLEVQEGGLSVSIPQIYFNQGIVGRSVRVDIYTTQGPMEMSLSNLEASAFNLEWRDFDRIEDGTYVDPLTNITSVVVRGTGSTVGGRAALTTSELRTKVTNGSVGGATPFDLEHEVNSLGYDITRLYDRSTSRVYMLSRHLDTISSSNFSSVGVVQASLDFRFEELINSDADVNAHLNSVTLLPSTLYTADTNGLTIIAPPELKNPTQYTEDEVIAVLNAVEPVYSPFHYVFENRNEYFDKRCYLMDQPEIVARNFVDANGSYPYDLSMQVVQVKYLGYGYRVALQIKSGDSIKLLNDTQVQIQLAFTPVNSSRRVYINGELSPSYVDDERVYTFIFNTEFEIDSDDVLMTNGFKASQTDNSDYGMELNQSFDVIFTVNGIPKIGDGSDLDTLKGHDLLPSDTIVLSHETIDINFGNRLSSLEGRTLTFIDEAKYEEWEEDVPLLRERPKYQPDSSGYIDVSIDGDSLTYTKIADIGDPVLDSDGEPRYIHRKGDLKLTNGKPVLIEDSKVIRRAGLVMFNAMFRYATLPDAVNAVKGKTAEILGYVQGDLEDIRKDLPPRTEIQFTPKSNIGQITVAESTGQEYNVKAGLSFQVDLFLTENAYKDISTHGLLKTQVRDVIIERIKDDILSTLSIEQAIKDRIGETLVTCNVGGITEAGIHVAAIQDSDKSFSVAPVMTMLSDGTITPKDDININIASISKGSTY